MRLMPRSAGGDACSLKIRDVASHRFCLCDGNSFALERGIDYVLKLVGGRIGARVPEAFVPIVYSAVIKQAGIGIKDRRLGRDLRVGRLH